MRTHRGSGPYPLNTLPPKHPAPRKGQGTRDTYPRKGHGTRDTLTPFFHEQTDASENINFPCGR